MFLPFANDDFLFIDDFSALPPGEYGSSNLIDVRGTVNQKCDYFANFVWTSGSSLVSNIEVCMTTGIYGRLQFCRLHRSRDVS